MLPQPSDDFAWTQVSGKPALVCRALEPFAAHFFTTREWRLGSTSPEDRSAGWEEVAAAAGKSSSLVRLRQVHGNSVVVRRAGFTADAGEMPEADIMASDDWHLALAIQTADCVPLLLADRKTGAVAAAHAGWRGLAAGAPRTAVEALNRAFGSRPQDLVAAIGPSVGACCYEVGGDVRSAFRDGGFDPTGWFFDLPQPSPTNPSMPSLPAGRRADRWFFDGWAAASDQLRQAGVPITQIHDARLCTASHGVFCSYRRDGHAAGRMAAVIRAQPRPSRY